ncbi:MAG: hypothetical protein QOI02_313 [Actinomycetota bacterium]|nr:hypothetical protein [Actinomycetota bacterium]
MRPQPNHGGPKASGAARKPRSAGLGARTASYAGNQPAGGTKHNGYGSCRLHGGMTRASQLHAAKLEAAARADHVARVMGLPIDTSRERPGFPLQTHAAGTPRRMPVATRVASHALQSA